MSKLFGNGGYQVTIKAGSGSKVFARITIGNNVVTCPVVSADLSVSPRVQIDQSISGKLYVSSAKGDMCSGSLTIIDGGMANCSNSKSSKLYGGLSDIIALHKKQGILERTVKIVLYDTATAKKVVGTFTGIISKYSVSVGQGSGNSVIHQLTLSILGNLE